MICLKVNILVRSFGLTICILVVYVNKRNRSKGTCVAGEFKGGNQEFYVKYSMIGDFPFLNKTSRQGPLQLPK